MKKFAFYTVIILALLVVGVMPGCKDLLPNQAVEHFNKGVALDDEGRYDEAIAEYNKAIEIDPNYANAYSNRGYGYLKKGQYDLAITDYTKAIQLDPKHYISYNGRGSSYIHIKQYKLAVSDFNKAIELNPSFVNASTNRDIATKMLNQASDYNSQGITLVSTGKVNEAINSFSNAINVYPNYPSAYTNRGIVYIINRQYDLAIADFNNALKLYSRCAPAYGGRGLAYIYKGDYKEAVTDLNKSVQIDPDEANVWNDLGVAQEQLGELNEAADSYNKALQLDPNNDGIKSNITFVSTIIKQGGLSGGIKGHYLGNIPYGIATAWQDTTDTGEILTPTSVTPTGGIGIVVKTLTGEWINDSPRYGLVMSDGGSYWNYDVVLKLVETDPNTGGLHVQQPNTFNGTIQMTLRSISGPVTTSPDLMSQVGKISEGPISGTREESNVKLNFGGQILRLTFSGDYLYGDTYFYDAGSGLTGVRPGSGSYITWTWSFHLKRK